MLGIQSCFVYVLRVAPVILSCIVFDFLLNSNMLNVLPRAHLLRAMADNIGHAFIAMFIWCVVRDYSCSRVLEVITCGMFASFIDIDHFIMARSLDIKVQ